VEALTLPLTYLHRFHAMPENLRVRARPELFVAMDRATQVFEPRDGLRSLPPLLKGYVRAGCCIGDGAVIDRQFGTTDVFIYFPLSGIDARYKSRFGLVK
jgi:putative hemolysin